MIGFQMPQTINLPLVAQLKLKFVIIFVFVFISVFIFFIIILFFVFAILDLANSVFAILFFVIFSLGHFG